VCLGDVEGREELDVGLVRAAADGVTKVVERVKAAQDRVACTKLALSPDPTVYTRTEKRVPLLVTRPLLELDRT
jgi:hypothetical protein